MMWQRRAWASVACVFLAGCVTAPRIDREAIAAAVRSAAEPFGTSYVRTVRELREEASAALGTTTDPATTRGLQIFLAATADFLAILDESRGEAPQRRRELIRERRDEYDGALFRDEEADLAITGLRDREARAFAASDQLFTDARSDYLAELWQRNLLFERKYFGEEGEASNVFEGALNGQLGITRAVELHDEDADRWPRQAGVSRLEAITRLEPIVAVDDAAGAGVLGTLGLVHHFFPDFVDDDASEFGTLANDDFLSGWIQRVGIRTGAGIVEGQDGSANFVVGGGLQIRSLTVWGLFDFETEEFLVALGAADLGLLTDLLPMP